MKYHELQVKANHSSRRVGRGIAAGQGKTAGRGTKGQKSRAGSSRRPGFEGGQNPLIQRFPKLRGFTSHRAVTENVQASALSSFSGSVDNFKLAEAGLVSSAHVRVKVIGSGPLSKKVAVKLQGATAAAKAVIEKAGGSFTVVDRIGREAKPDKKT